MAKTTADQYGFGFGGGTIFFNEVFFETLLMVIVIIWLLRWLFGFSNFFYGGGCY